VKQIDRDLYVNEGLGVVWLWMVSYVDYREDSLPSDFSWFTIEFVADAQEECRETLDQRIDSCCLGDGLYELNISLKHHQLVTYDL
jgi:hypothetical protein